MFSSADGTRTLTALITMGDAEVDLLQVFPPALDRLVKAVF
jgi:D-alanyl-D-alanine carboxypeptidase